MIEATVQRVVASALYPRAMGREIGPEAQLRDGLGADSIDMIAIAAAIEDALDIEITDDELAAVVSIADLTELGRRKAVRR